MANQYTKQIAGSLPFGKESYKRTRASTPEQILLNFLVEHDISGAAEDENEQAMLIQRPGLTLFNTVPAGTQALYTTANPSFNYNFVVAGGKLYSFDDSTSTLLGTVGGDTSSRVAMTANFDRLMVVSYPNIFCYGAVSGTTDPTTGVTTGASSTPVFRQITVPDFFGTGAPPVVDVVMKDGYFVFACEDGTFFWIVPGEDTIQPLNFATAESDPDGLVGVALLNNNLVFFGNRTIENWQSTGNADLPFQRTTGQDYARGALSRDSIVNLDNSVFWVGEDRKAYRAAGVPQKISTDGIDERLKLAASDPNAWTFSWDSHLVYVLNIPGQGTFGYDISTQKWSQFSSTDADTLWDPWCATQTSQGWLVGSGSTGQILLIGDSSNDNGVPFPRRASATGAIPSNPKRMDNVVLDVGSSGPCSVGIRWADADQSLQAQTWIDLDCPAGGAELTYYRMGAARSPYRTLEVQVLDDVVFRLSGGRLGAAWR